MDSIPRFQKKNKTQKHKNESNAMNIGSNVIDKRNINRVNSEENACYKSQNFIFKIQINKNIKGKTRQSK